MSTVIAKFDSQTVEELAELISLHVDRRRDEIIAAPYSVEELMPLQRLRSLQITLQAALSVTSEKQTDTPVTFSLAIN